MKRSLFDPVRIGRMELPNRFVRSATWEGMCDEYGRPTSRLAALYGDLAHGDVGLIITGYTVVHPLGRQMTGAIGACSDSQTPLLGKLAHAVHDAGGKLMAQLFHAGAQTSQRTIGETPVGPSAVQSPFYSGVPRAMTTSEIRSVASSFGQSARRAKEAGFDGVQLHGAHGYLINQFLSPLTNLRKDKYGGSVRNRFRFLKEVYLSVREQVGPDYPVAIKLTGSDNLKGGIQIEDTVWFAGELEKLGIDAIEVSAGTSGSGEGVPVRKGINTETKEGYNAPFAVSIRSAVKVPVILVGGLRSLPVMERLLGERTADLFALSRPLIREPNLVNRWKEDPGHRSTCTSCNLCFRPGMREGGIYCVPERKLRERNL
ncbi:MAG: NADH:flavin oxidoreductase [Pseudomonadota bacterium]|jgi:2,4-dienoyl-CoA reductase-like NADH-dependent reductase (Old Yellow Enzyme family)